MYDYRTEFEKNHICFTSDEFRDVIDDEEEAEELAEKTGGKVKLCYYDNNYYPSTTSGIFLGFLVGINGWNFADMDEYEDYKEEGWI